jgi:hypothetical protein
LVFIPHPGRVPQSFFYDLPAGFREDASDEISLPVSIVNSIICLDEKKPFCPAQVVSQSPIELSQILNSSTLADVKTLSETLQVDQAEHDFSRRSFIENENIRCFEVIVIDSLFMKRLE